MELVARSKSTQTIDELRPKLIRVYAIDDDPSILSFFSFVCDRAGDMVLVGTAVNGEEAIADVFKCKPDIVVVDLRMRGMSGIECSRHLRLLSPNLKIIIFTGYADRANVLEAFR